MAMVFISQEVAITIDINSHGTMVKGCVNFSNDSRRNYQTRHLFLTKCHDAFLLELLSETGNFTWSTIKMFRK